MFFRGPNSLAEVLAVRSGQHAGSYVIIQREEPGGFSTDRERDSLDGGRNGGSEAAREIRQLAFDDRLFLGKHLPRMAATVVAIA